MFLTSRYQIIASSHSKTTKQNIETCIGYSQTVSASDSSGMRYMKYISMVYSEKKKWTNRKKDMISSFVFNYNSRIIQEHFQAKIGNFQCNVCLKKNKNTFPSHTLWWDDLDPAEHTKERWWRGKKSLTSKIRKKETICH